MTTSMPHHDRDRATARSATGLLATFNQAGVLSAADVHVATTLARLASEPDEHVALADLERLPDLYAAVVGALTR